MARDNRRGSVARSVRSGRSSISTLTQLDGSYSSYISGITLDDDLGSTVERTSISSYRNFGKKLKTMPEQQRASDPDMEEVQEYLDSLRLASSDANSNNTNHHRFSSCDGDALCHIPRRKSSSSNLDYRTAHSSSVGGYFLREEGDENDHRSGNPLNGQLDSCETYFTGLEQEDEFLPLSFTPRSRSSHRSSVRGLSSYASGMSSISLDLGDIFGDEDEEVIQSDNIFGGVSTPSVDVSPQIAKRRSSLSWTSSNDPHITARITNVNLLLENSLGDSKPVPEDSGDICLAGDARFQTKCPKEKANSIAQPTRRVSAYTIDMRVLHQLTPCTQGWQHYILFTYYTIYIMII